MPLVLGLLVPGAAIAAPPANDAFGNATFVSSIPFLNIASTVDATTEGSEPLNPSCVGTNMGHTVWYRLNVAIDLVLEIDTEGSSYDTVLAIYTGTTLSNLSEVVCDDDSGTGTLSRVVLMAEASAGNYYIQVGGFGTASGSLTFNLVEGPPPNNDFGSALVLASPPTGHDVSTTAATTEASEPLNPSCVGTDMGHTVWYRINVAIDLVLQIDTVGSNHDTVLAVYTGSTLPSLSEVACSDDIAPGSILQSRVTFEAQASVATYYIQVGGYGASFGVVNFNMVEGPPVHDDFADRLVFATPPSGHTVSTAAATTETGEPAPSCQTNYGKSVWYTYTPSQNGVLRALTPFDLDGILNQFDTIIAIYTGSPVGSLTGVACNDDSIGNLASIEFPVAAGTPYQIQLAGWSGQSGIALINLNVVSACGNSVIETGEDCDDGNMVGGDCCSATCQFEVGGCSDGVFCNGTDSCSAGICSIHAGNPCQGPDGDGNCSESCNEGADNCLATDPNGSTCTDALFCNGSDTCSGGACGQHAGNPCQGPDGDGNCSESCNEGTDNCLAADPNGSPCTDSNLCTTVDSCQGGSCQGSVPPVCDDADVCTTDSCSPGSGCVFDPLPDTDADGLCDNQDNCPFVPNDPLFTNSDPLPAGDACQCGDLDGDGDLDLGDVLLARQRVVGATPSGSPDFTRCDVIAPAGCGVEDIFQIDRHARGLSATIGNVCSAYGP